MYLLLHITKFHCAVQNFVPFYQRGMQKNAVYLLSLRRGRLATFFFLFSNWILEKSDLKRISCDKKPSASYRALIKRYTKVKINACLIHIWEANESSVIKSLKHILTYKYSYCPRRSWILDEKTVGQTIGVCTQKPTSLGAGSVTWTNFFYLPGTLSLDA